MMLDSHIACKTDDGRELILQNVDYNLSIDNLMATCTIIQNYRNPYDTNIEAVYTFPLDSDAVLLEIEIEINGRRLKGKITEKSAAEEKYEEAVEQGDRAIMVEKSSEGIYTVNIANILPKENISVRLSFTQLLEWRGEQVRFALPTVIAQKYGNPAALNLDDLTDPETSLFAENRFNFNLQIKGVLKESQISVPSHHITIQKEDLSTNVTIDPDTNFMNRDIVFIFQTEKAPQRRSFGLIGRDFRGYAAIASFYPTFEDNFETKPKSVTFVIDCSGSMYGISIDRAKIALSKALDLLKERDSFNIVAFGSSSISLFDGDVLATQEHIDIAKAMIKTLDADMGGTEMANALNRVYRRHATNPSENSYLFLITDGEIYDHERVIQNARKSHLSHFVVGIGYASDDALLKQLASATEGFFQSIDPNEKMDGYILDLFKKIDLPKTVDMQVEWSEKPLFTHLPATLFEGDTLYVYGIFQNPPVGEVTLTYTLENGTTRRTTTKIDANSIEQKLPSTISKLVVDKKIQSLMLDPELNRDKIVDYSTRYQLFSEFTNYILVDELAKEEKPLSLPTIHKIYQMPIYTGHHKHVYTNQAYVNRYPFFNYQKMHRNIIDLIPALPTSMIVQYLEKLNDWFVKHKKLPQTSEELEKAGISLGMTLTNQKVKSFIDALYAEWKKRGMPANKFDQGFIYLLEHSGKP